jgi:hypothetical protein
VIAEAKARDALGGRPRRISLAGTSEAKVTTAVARKALPEILGKDLQLYLDEWAGRCHPINAWRSPESLLIAYRVEGQTELAQLRLVPTYLREDGEEHWKGTFRWGPRGGRHCRTVHLVGKMSWQFESDAELVGK